MFRSCLILLHAAAKCEWQVMVCSAQERPQLRRPSLQLAATAAATATAAITGQHCHPLAHPTPQR